MFCKNPMIIKGHAFGCGQCMPCRINKQRVWTHRIMLERAAHSDNSFVTLTYSDEKLPDDNSLRPRDLTLFIKRLRDKVAPTLKLRYYGVGEYGETTERPHYHIALFGFPSCRRGRTTVNRNGYCCPQCSLVAETWGLGNVFIGSLERESAQYVAGYVLKKLMGNDDENRLNGRHPEFARMSLRPGIGLSFMDDVADTLLASNLEKIIPDVPTSLRCYGQNLPLGRYLRTALRERIGRDKQTPPEIVEEFKEKLRPLREAAYNSARPGQKENTYRGALIDLYGPEHRKLAEKMSRKKRRRI